MDKELRITGSKFDRELDKQIFEMIHNRKVNWMYDQVPFYSYDWLHVQFYLIGWLHGLDSKRVTIQTLMTKSETIVSLEVEDKIEMISGFTQQVGETMPMALCKAVVELKDVLI